MTEATILVVEDQEAQRSLLVAFLSSRFSRVLAAKSGREALRVLADAEVDAIVTDLRMPGMDGLELLEVARRRSPEAEVVLVSAFATVPVAVEAMRRGAFEVLAKPVDPEALAAVVERALERGRLKRENADLRRRLGEGERVERFVGSSPAVREMLDLVRRAARSTATVLLTGESGTGKERIADLLHSLSPRAAGPLVKVNCPAIPETLLESELFGHAKGSFTGAHADRIGRFEEASGGTIFLDEIAEMPAVLQAKLLRALQEREVVRIGENQPRPADARVVAATNRDLEAEVRAGRFREDLYYRLNVIRIEVPPLRRRREDIRLLAEHFLRIAAARHGATVDGFSPDALTALEGYGFPGNVRELENLVEQAVVLARGRRIELDELPARFVAAPGKANATTTPTGLFAALDELEKRLLLQSLQRNSWVQTRAADELGISERVLRYKMAKHGIGREGDSTV
jgi:DNA-binding NtrC family response regulator